MSVQCVYSKEAKAAGVLERVQKHERGEEGGRECWQKRQEMQCRQAHLPIRCRCVCLRERCKNAKIKTNLIRHMNAGGGGKPSPKQACAAG